MHTVLHVGEVLATVHMICAPFDAVRLVLLGEGRLHH